MGQTDQSNANVTERRRSEWSDMSHEIVPPVLWRLFVLIWLLFLYYPLLTHFDTHPAALQVVMTLVGAAVFMTLYLYLALPLPFGADVPSRLALGTHLQPLALATLLVADITLLTLLAGPDWLWFFIFASIALGVRLPPRPAVVAVAAVAALTITVGVGPFGWVYALRVALPVAVVGLGMIGMGELVRTIRALRVARLEIARLAISEERLRFARDLHDLLGQSLSTITLKNELARNLVRTQPERAVQELGDAIGMARAALRGVREAVMGYRQPTLASELRNAQEILHAAGIAYQVEGPHIIEGNVPISTETVLAWAVREAVTNVVRHSGARTCTIGLQWEGDSTVLTVTDDGRGVSASSSGDAGDRRAGTGLRGLAERVAQVDGHVEAGPWMPTGFRVRVAVPVLSSEMRQAANVVKEEESRG